MDCTEEALVLADEARVESLSKLCEPQYCQKCLVQFIAEFRPRSAREIQYPGGDAISGRTYHPETRWHLYDEIDARRLCRKGVHALLRAKTESRKRAMDTRACLLNAGMGTEG